jgi:ribose/xylose/arabinose/galactoside ABC-type transport system permease subunit
LLIILASIVAPSFASPTNIFNVLRQIIPLGMLALGMTFVILTGGIDLSVGSVMTLLVALVCGIMNFHDSMIIVAILSVCAIGVVIGLLNGLAVTMVGMPPFIVTLGGLAIYQGLALLYTTGYPMAGTTEAFRFITVGKIGPAPICIFIFVAAVVICQVTLKRSVFGRRIFAAGGNPEASRLAGIPIKRIVIGAYMVCGLLTGIGSVVLASRMGVADPLAGQGFELDAIAAVVIGGTPLSGGIGSIGGTVVGVLIMGIINNLLNLLNVNAFLQKVVKGLIIVIAVGVYSLREKDKEK